MMYTTISEREPGRHNRVLMCCLLLLPVFSCTRAQYGNASFAPAEFIGLLIQNAALEEKMQVDTMDPQLNVVLSLKVFIVSSEDGQPYVSPTTVHTAVATANTFFKNIGIQFQIPSITIIPEYEYGLILDRDSTEELEIKYAVPDFINLFLVDSIFLEGSPWYGYTTFPEDSLHTSVFLHKEYIGGKHLTTLLGNFFGLLRTHETAGGMEAVNQSNCKVAGDFLCDTWADPGLNGLVDDNCLFTGEIVDAYGDYYVPSVANLMSDSNDPCKCIFSLQQYRRMKYYYIHYREFLR